MDKKEEKITLDAEQTYINKKKIYLKKEKRITSIAAN